MATPNIFKVNPVTYEDNYSAKQNELVLNHQFNTQINKVKFIDEYIRSAVNTGTSIIRVGWEEKQDIQDIPVPQYVPQQIDPNDAVGISRFERIKRSNQDTIYTNNIAFKE